MDARQIFLERHACVHSKAMHTQGSWKEEDTICSDLTEREFRLRPTADHNSVAWLIWHMARCEDVAINTVLRGSHEILDRDHWLAQMGIPSRHIGTGAPMTEVDEISRSINLNTLRAYRAAVGQETRVWVSDLDFSNLNKLISVAEARRATDKGDLGENAAWVEEHWSGQGWTRSSFLFWLAIEHNWFHIGEIWGIRNLLKHPGC